jgi:hypothetical protein
MTIRELEPEEFHRLEGHPALNGLMPQASACRVVIAENASGEIIGFQMLTFVVHLEPVWVHPSYRGGLLVGRMWKLATKLLDHLRVSVGFCFCEDPTVADYLQRLGLRELPYRTFLFDPLKLYPPTPPKDA